MVACGVKRFAELRRQRHSAPVNTMSVGREGRLRPGDKSDEDMAAILGLRIDTFDPRAIPVAHNGAGLAADRRGRRAAALCAVCLIAGGATVFVWQASPHSRDRGASTVDGEIAVALSERGKNASDVTAPSIPVMPTGALALSRRANELTATTSQVSMDLHPSRNFLAEPLPLTRPAKHRHGRTISAGSSTTRFRRETQLLVEASDATNALNSAELLRLGAQAVRTTLARERADSVALHEQDLRRDSANALSLRTERLEALDSLRLLRQR